MNINENPILNPQQESTKRIPFLLLFNCLTNCRCLEPPIRSLLSALFTNYPQNILPTWDLCFPPSMTSCSKCFLRGAVYIYSRNHQLCQLASRGWSHQQLSMPRSPSICSKQSSQRTLGMDFFSCSA